MCEASVRGRGPESCSSIVSIRSFRASVVYRMLAFEGFSSASVAIWSCLISIALGFMLGYRTSQPKDQHVEVLTEKQKQQLLTKPEKVVPRITAPTPSFV